VRRPLPPVLLGLALLAAAAGADEARWSRQAEVERPGTVVLELDGRAAERAELDLDLIGPDGRLVPFQLYRATRAARTVRVTRVRSEAAGWRVELDAGPAPPRHHRLRFALAEGTAAADVLLEGGDGAGGWRELAHGSLFRLGTGKNLQNFELAYSPTEVRLLRLTWPRDAGLPELLETEILAAPAAGEIFDVPVDCSSEGKAVDCTFAASAECSTLEVELEPRDEPIAYWFYAAREGEWLLQDEGERRQHGRLDFSLERGLVRRLRLHSAVLPRVTGAHCRRGGSRLAFEAKTAGAYQLVYGRLATPERKASWNLPPEQETSARLGPEVEGKAPEWPPAVEPGVPLKGKFLRSWPIEKISSRGQLVALTLPGEVSRLGGWSSGSLRIDAGGLQLPFVSKPAALPEKLLTTTLRPVAVPGAPGKSRAEIKDAGTGNDLKLILFAPGPFERQVRLERIAARPRNPHYNELSSVPWACPASLGCELETDLFVPGDATTPDFFVEFADGDNPPLRAVAAELWASRTLLYFVDPGLPLVLRWDPDLGEPKYDLESLEDVLPHQESAAAKLGLELPRQGAAEAPRWLLLAAIAVAVAALLAVLARVLRGPA
jgi:hypothetical protein